MTDTSQDIPGDLVGPRSNWQGIPEKMPVHTKKIPAHVMNRPNDIDEVCGGVAGQLSDQAHDLSSRGA